MTFERNITNYSFVVKVFEVWAFETNINGYIYFRLYIGFSLTYNVVKINTSFIHSIRRLGFNKYRLNNKIMFCISDFCGNRAEFPLFFE
ncbi:hypothetical protein HanPSC8_Chr17g0784361 [Helianthus annuus]|nr:hypothetical protein HanPSC8_Chr17g0784361 [Helianthus annuus]